MPSLPELQRRLAVVFTHPGGVRPGLTAAGFHRDRRPVTAVVADRPPAPLHNRLAVYSDAYFLRLAEVLGQDFAACRRAAGTDGFQRLAADYLLGHPSRSPFINDVGGAFAPFLENHPSKKTLPFLPDLARLEWNVLQSLFTDRAPTGSLAGLGPKSRLRLDPTARLLETSWAVERLWENRLRPPAKGARRLTAPLARRLLIHRDDAWVRVRPIGKEEFVILKRLKEGRPLAGALKGLEMPAPTLQHRFARWTQDGILKGSY